MSKYVLHITVSPSGENSYSRKLGNSFLETIKATQPNLAVRTRDLSTTPIDHLDGEGIFAGYVAPDQRSPGMVAKHQHRLDLIAEISGADAIVIDTPMWNWNVPSVLKAYIDQIVLPGTFDSNTKSLAGKSVTALVATGGAYGEGSWHPEWDFLTSYLKTSFGILGSTDVEIIRTEYTLAGVVPAMESLIPQKEESYAKATAATIARARNIGSSENKASPVSTSDVKVEGASPKVTTPAVDNNCACIIS